MTESILTLNSRSFRKIQNVSMHGSKLLSAKNQSCLRRDCCVVNSKPLLRYRLLLGFLSPWLFFKVAMEACKVRSRRFFLQRFGCSYQQLNNSPVWIHCTSVGEVTAARPLIEQILEQLPGVQVLLTTTTPTGAATAISLGWGNLEHQYLPVDFRRSVAKLINATRPGVLLIMETEIWPNLILQARQEKIPALIVNGRVSKRTLNVPDWLKPVYQQVLPELDAILCKSELDATRYIQLGANPESVRTIGNIKFATEDHIATVCDIKRSFWLAASTHEDEELQICSALKSSQLLNQSLLVIAPRHPHRSPEIQKAIAQCGLNIAVRSKSEIPDENTQVYIADTLGEMNNWLSAAQLVFMGGSLVEVGGHNLLQPAAAGVPIISGKHLDNVSDEAGLLMEAGAMQKVESATDLIACVENLLGDTEGLKLMGQAGKEMVAQKSGVLEDYMEYILPLISLK